MPTCWPTSARIRGGHNIRPYDLEQAVGALPGIRRGCVAVFGAADPHSRSERVVVLAETRVAEPAQRAALRERIAQHSIAVLGLPPDDIVLAPPHAVLRTSSGKIRRAACRSLYEQVGLAQAGHGIAWQYTALWLDALRRRWRDPRRGLAFVTFGAWYDTAALQAGPWVAVANHASYVDWLLLAAALPAPACFVAKRELARLPPLRWLLERVGVRFVERDDVHASVEDAKRLVQAAQAGECLVFFPEGTLTRAPGLRPFHMGAFIAAAQAGVAVVPVSLRGTRSVLRDGAWWPRRGAVAVQVHGLLRAQGSAWGDAVRLRDRAREQVARGCGEPVADR